MPPPSAHGGLDPD
jgi:ribonuclease HI